MPTILSLPGWAGSWLPDHPDLAERDPDVVLGWLAQQVVREHLPGLDVVAPYGCLTDPFLDASRYVYLESAMSTLLALARGRLGWLDAFEDGSLTAAGGPDLVSRVAEWFQRSPEHSGATSAGLLRASRPAARLTEAGV